MVPLLRAESLLLLIIASLSIIASPLPQQRQQQQQPLSSQPRITLDDIQFERDGWFDPRFHHGSMLNRATETLGEPLNIIISNRSSPDILRENGFIAYSRSLGLEKECANVHLGDPQYANLGDGGGWLPELFEMRESRGFPWIGSCLESVVGGNHFRAWKQNSTLAHSGAWFLSASKEIDIRGHHRITQNGYNDGRDIIVNVATKGTKWRGRTWETTVEYVEGLLRPGSEGINHDLEQDGRVAVLTVTEY